MLQTVLLTVMSTGSKWGENRHGFDLILNSSRYKYAKPTNKQTQGKPPVFVI